MQTSKFRDARAACQPIRGLSAGKTDHRFSQNSPARRPTLQGGGLLLGAGRPVRLPRLGYRISRASPLRRVSDCGERGCWLFLRRPHSRVDINNPRRQSRATRQRRTPLPPGDLTGSEGSTRSKGLKNPALQVSDRGVPSNGYWLTVALSSAISCSVSSVSSDSCAPVGCVDDAPPQPVNPIAGRASTDNSTNKTESFLTVGSLHFHFLGTRHDARAKSE